MDFYIYKSPTVGRRQFTVTVTVTDDRGAQATSEAVAIDVKGSSGPVMPVGQWADVNGDGIYDQILATIELARDLSLQSASNGVSAQVLKQTYVEVTTPKPIPLLNLFADNWWSFDFANLGWTPSWIVYERYWACVSIPSSLASQSFSYRVQSSGDGVNWDNMGPAFPGSPRGISHCFALDFLNLPNLNLLGIYLPDINIDFSKLWRIPKYIRIVTKILKAIEGPKGTGSPGSTQEIPKTIRADLDGDGIKDVVNVVEVIVLTRKTHKKACPRLLKMLSCCFIKT